MKKVLNLFAIFVLGMIAFCSCSNDKNETETNPNSLAGKVWLLQEGTVTSVFTFLTETAMKVEETSTSGPASLRETRSETTVTYQGTYSYDSKAKTATFNYNSRIRQLADIQISDGSVSCKIDNVAVTMTTTSSPINDITTDKEFLENTGKEFVGLFTANQAAPYTSIINAIKDTNTKEVDDDIEEIIDGLASHTGTNPDVYKYAIKAATFNGRYVLEDGVWKKYVGNSLRAEFQDDKGRQCVLTVTTSGDTKKVIVYEEEDYDWEYNYNTDNYEKYLDKRNIYEAELPSHIECILTQGGSQLVNIVVNLDLSKLTAGQKVNLSRNSLSFDCTANFVGVAKITTKANYVAQGTSSVNFVVEKNGSQILKAEASSESNLSGAPEEIDDDQLKNVSNTNLYLDILGKVQIKGTCSNISSLIDALDEANDYDNRYNKQVVEQYVRQINNLLRADVYYNGNLNIVRANLLFNVDYEESYRWDNNTYIQTYKYFPATSIKFADGSSYFMTNYFTEDAFKSLVDMFNDLTDKVEKQINKDDK